MGVLGGGFFFTGLDDTASSQRILIVDDESRFRDSLLLLLAAPDREFHTCASGAEALVALESQDYDLVLLDLRLPDATGLDILEWLNRNHRSMTVIVVSADESIDAAIGVLRYGVYDFVRKPYQVEEIQHAVDKALQKRRLERTNALITARLEQSERLHRYLVDHSPDIIYTLDHEGRFAFINSRIESLLGYGRQELIGQHYSVIVHEEDRDKAHYAFNERRTGDRAAQNVEIRLKCKDGAQPFKHFENRCITIALSAMGIYEEPNGKKTQDNARRFLGTYGVARDITERKKAEEMISFQAYHDLLTHLPNRILFKDRVGLAMAQAGRAGKMVGVMFLDIDRFKLVNDTFGHAEGDELLKGMANRLKNCLRRGDTLARQGGDEFTVLLPDLSNADDAAVIAQKILDELKRPFFIAGQEFRGTVSIGIAVYPRDGDSVDGLIKHADIAMYHVKSRGKNGYQFFSTEMNAVFHQKLALENDLRRALERGEFELYYQPQVSVAQRRIVGMEALIRWHHPSHGMLDPSRFIGLAEESGLIGGISDWVLDAACRQLSAWRNSGLADLRISVNLSPREFEKGDLVGRIAAAVQSHRIPANGLEVEITENLLLQDAEGVIAKVRRLRDQGVRVSIDDFGTRYSSLNYLQKFPISSLKIDQSFVRDMSQGEGQFPIIMAIVAIARGFGLHLLAEGVESKAQMEALQALGCDEMQGFFFSPPLPIAEINRFLSGKPRDTRLH